MHRRSFSALALAAGAALPLLLSAGTPATAQSAARNAMERCVDRVLTRLQREKHPEPGVGRIVTTQCDKELQATLAEAIAKGEASTCTVEKCIGVARDETSREAREEYQKRLSAR